jgi:hypothetical protein
VRLSAVIQPPASISYFLFPISGNPPAAAAHTWQMTDAMPMPFSCTCRMPLGPAANANQLPMQMACAAGAGPNQELVLRKAKSLYAKGEKSICERITSGFVFISGIYAARARVKPPPPSPCGLAPGSNGPSGPRRRKQGRGSHRSRRQPTPLPLPGMC